MAAVARGLDKLVSPPFLDEFVSVFFDAHEAVCAAVERPGARNPDSRTALAVAVVKGKTLYWASMGDCDVFLVDDTYEPLGPLRSYFLGSPMTRTELADRLERGTADIPDGASVIVASDGFRDFAAPLGAGGASLTASLAGAADAGEAAHRLVELACAGGAGDDVAVALAPAKAAAPQCRLNHRGFERRAAGMP